MFVFTLDRVYVLSFQTKALLVGGNHFRIIPPNCNYCWFGKHVSAKLSFFFYKERLLFSAPLNLLPDTYLHLVTKNKYSFSECIKGFT